MPNPLDPFWDAYGTTAAALKVVRRCLTVGGIDRAKAFSNTAFYGIDDTACSNLLDRAQAELDESVILGLYATFEATLRDHVASHASLLHAAQQPSQGFGIALANSFALYCDQHRMDELADLFASAVGQGTLAQVGNIRVYRHWLAHGRRWAQPPTVTPASAYQTLTTFLKAAGLA